MGNALQQMGNSEDVRTLAETHESCDGACIAVMGPLLSVTVSRHCRFSSATECSMMPFQTSHVLSSLQVMVKRGDKIEGPSGPIVVCTRNNDLQGVIDNTPQDRREGMHMQSIRRRHASTSAMPLAFCPIHLAMRQRCCSLFQSTLAGLHHHSTDRYSISHAMTCRSCVHPERHAAAISRRAVSWQQHPSSGVLCCG